MTTTMRKSMALKQNLTINDFTHIVPWDYIAGVMGQRRYNKFVKWMRGQTVTPYGVYPGDLDRFLKGLPVID